MDPNSNVQINTAVLLIFFNRPDCLKKTFEAVRKARPSRLYLYQDGARNQSDFLKISECRDIVSKIDWPCNVKTFFQKKNMGVDPSEYIAIKWAFFFEKQCIILEDDDVPCSSFFPFCEFLLDKFADDDRINQVCGLTNFEKSTFVGQYDYSFVQYGCIWGWATWKRVVDEWDPSYSWMNNPENLKILKCKLGKGFSSFLKQAEKQRAGKIAYYEIINGANCFLHGRINIIPTKNMIHNCGYSNGVHSNAENLNLLEPAVKKLYTMGTYNVTFPLREPPLYLVDEKQDKRLQRFLFRKPNVIRKFFRYLFYGGPSFVIDKIKRKK